MVDLPTVTLNGPCETCGATGVVELSALPGVGSCPCGSLDAHSRHVWEMPGQGYWNCDGYDGKYQIGDRRWWWCLSTSSPMTRHQVIIEIKDWRGGTFVCEVVDPDGSPDFREGDPVYHFRDSMDRTRDIEDLL